MEQTSRTRLPTHFRVCPECGLNNAPANNRPCPNCNHDPDWDVTPEQAQAFVDYALRTAGHDPSRSLRALDAVPECYDHMGTPAMRLEVEAPNAPSTSPERRRLAKERLKQLGAIESSPGEKTDDAHPRT